MQLVPGDPTTEIPIEWYWAPEGAQLLSGGAFCSSNWDYDKLDGDPVIGEQYSSPRTYSKGVNIWGYKGICQIGTDRQFFDGLSKEEYLHPPSEVPACCRPGGPIVEYVSSWSNVDGTLLYNQPTGDVVAEVNQAFAFTWSGFHTFNNSVTIDLSSNPLFFYLQVFGNVGAGRSSVFFVSGNGVTHVQGCLEINGAISTGQPSLTVGAATGQIGLSIKGNGTLALTADAINVFSHGIGTMFRVTSTGQICTNQGVAVGAAGTALGQFPVFDPSGTQLGYVPYYDTGPSSGGGGGGTIIASQNDFRLTLQSGTPVTTSDVVSGVIYFTPYVGENISTYDSSTWTNHQSGEILLTAVGLSGNNYDVFVYWSGSALTLELSNAWTSGTIRADAISQQNGVWVKAADPSRRYVGTLRAGTSGWVDSAAQRFCWNASNRVRRNLSVLESTMSWPYSANVWRQANGNGANQLELVVGLPGVLLDVSVIGNVSIPANGDAGVNIGEDSTSVPLTTALFANASDAEATFYNGLPARVQRYVPVGYHYYAWLEKADTSGTTFFGLFAGYDQSGIIGVSEA